MENITSWTEKKKSKMQAHVTVFLVYCGYRERGTKKYYWKCALTLCKKSSGVAIDYKWGFTLLEDTDKIQLRSYQLNYEGIQ